MTDRKTALPQRLHEVLLALAGRIDDSALTRARRLAARARADEAAELVAGTLVAGQIPVRSAEQRELGEILAAAGTDEWLAAQLTVADNADEAAHRFSGAGAGAGMPEALSGVLDRLPDVRSVHAAWRNTVAGRIPGPMPQRVVLVEVGPDASELATAFRVDTALRKAGISAVVEVLAEDGRNGQYHQQALAVAERVATRTEAGEPKRAAGQAPAAERPAATPAASERPAPKRAPANGAATERPAARKPAAQEPPAAEPARAEQSAPVPRTPVKHAAEEKPATAETPVRSNGNVPARRAAASHAKNGDGIEPGEMFQPPAAESAPAAQPARRAHRKPPDLPPPPEPLVERTTEMSTSELAALRDKLGANGQGRGAPADRTVAEMPQVDDPRVYDRDRDLLSELHAELAKRERAEATRVEMNAWDRGA